MSEFKEELNVFDHLQPYEDANLEDIKNHYARMFNGGMPLIIYPHMVKDVEALGMKKGEHFLVYEKIPA